MSGKVSHITSIENEFASYYIEDGLLYLIFKPDVYIGFYAAQEVVADRVFLQDGRDFFVVCDTTGISGTNHAAREYLASTGSEKVLGIAFAVSSRIARIMLFLYLKEYLPLVKTNIFESQKDATFYLKGVLHRYKSKKTHV